MQGNKQLGAFLRSRRARLHPTDVGLPEFRRRRTPGLRREEVAQLAGISVEWYVKLEQGRAVFPSTATISALGDALRLDTMERAHLQALTGAPQREAFAVETVPDTLRLLVTRMPEPAYILGQRWDILAWNAAAVDLFRDFGRMPTEDRNILLYMLLDPAAKRLFGASWSEEARRMVSLFRVTHDLWAGDAAFEALVDRLREGCPKFATWWTSHDVGTPLSGVKLLTHPIRGKLRLEFATFQANDNPALKLALYAQTGGR